MADFQSDELPISIDVLQKRLGLHFNTSDLLEQAMTHRSYANEMNVIQPDNERLE